jgi:hypothetical protein
MKNPKDSKQDKKKGQKGGKHKNKDDKDLEDLPVDLVFCYQAYIILQDLLKKADYIGTYTTSNSKSKMSKMIGSQIDMKLKNQQELEKIFDSLIIEKTLKVALVEEEAINKLNVEINKYAEELKSSTNSICKTLDENPDIPKNLIKAKRDQKIMVTDLSRFFDDFILGKLNNFNTVIESYNNKKINIDSLRKEEMKYFRELKQLNENLAKEEADYNKDQVEMNQNLLRMKKLLAKTKLEENLFIEYQKNQIAALSALHKSNFKEEENKMRKEIKDKEEEKEKISKLNEFVYAYLKEQKLRYEAENSQWEKTKKTKFELNEEMRNGLIEKNNQRKTNIENLQKKIQNYRLANEHLTKVASELNYTNFNTIHGPDVKLPPIYNVPEQKEPEQPKNENDIPIPEQPEPVV